MARQHVLMFGSERLLEMQCYAFFYVIECLGRVPHECAGVWNIISYVWYLFSLLDLLMLFVEFQSTRIAFLSLFCFLNWFQRFVCFSWNFNRLALRCWIHSTFWIDFNASSIELAALFELDCFLMWLGMARRSRSGSCEAFLRNTRCIAMTSRTLTGTTWFAATSGSTNGFDDPNRQSKIIKFAASSITNHSTYSNTSTCIEI